jgi:hypothetical protein
MAQVNLTAASKELKRAPVFDVQHKTVRPMMIDKALSAVMTWANLLRRIFHWSRG